MKRDLFVLTLMFIIATTSCFAKSMIVFDKTVHDFGNVSKESTVKYTFSFKNNGKGLLIIDRIKTG